MTRTAIIRRINRLCREYQRSSEYLASDGSHHLSAAYDRARDLLLQVPLETARRAYAAQYGLPLPEAAEAAYQSWS